MLDTPLSLYIHLPWCIKKCPYCDFNSHEMHSDIPEQDYIDALILDLDQQIKWLYEREIISIFIGGGTPSLFSANSIKRLLNAVHSRLLLCSDIEITLEVNPGTLDQKNFIGYREAGVNRLSIGIQSFNDLHLKKLGRIHSAQLACDAIAAVKKAGFKNFNIDLMYALPQQTLSESASDIKQAIQLEPTHISYYQLTLEPQTYFYNHPPSLPTNEVAWKMQQQGIELLSQFGYQQYEVSAYCKPGFSCRHNKNYWLFGDYLGIGAGAHQKVSDLARGKIFRSEKSRHPQQYIHQMHTGISHQEPHNLSNPDITFEFLLNALRLKGGFSPQQFSKHTGLKFIQLKPTLDSLEKDGLLAVRPDSICCSEKGYQFLDDVLQNLLPIHTN